MNEVKTIELSKRLAELVEYHDAIFKYRENIASMYRCELSEESSKHKQWADDIRSLIIPPPGERDE